MQTDALEQALLVARQSGDSKTIARLLFDRGMALHDRGDEQTAIDSLQEASDLAEQISDEPLSLRARIALAHLLRQQGEIEAARMLYQEALRRLREAELAAEERDNLLGQTFLGLGRIFEAQNQRDAALAAWQRSLGFFLRGGHREWAELIRHLLSGEPEN